MRDILSILRQQMRRYPLGYAFLSLLMLLTAALWICEPLYATYAINRMLQIREGVNVPYMTLFLGWAVLFVCISVVQTTEKFVGWKLTERLILDYREKVFSHVLRLGVSFHTRQKSGEVVKILDNAADTLADLQRQLYIQMVPSFLAAAVFLIIGFTLHPLMAGVLVFSVAIYMLIAILGTRRTYHLQHEVNKLWVESIGRAYDAVTNVFSVKSGAQEETELSRMRAVHERTHDKQQQVNRRWAMVEAVNFFMLTRMLLIAIGIYLYARGDISLGLVYFFQTSFFRVLTPFEMLGGMLPQWNKQTGRVRLSQELLATPIDVRSKPGAVSIDDIRGEIRFEDVSFSYARERTLSDEEEEHPSSLPPQQDMLPPPEEEEHMDRKPLAQRHAEESEIIEPKTQPQEPEVLRGIDLAIHAGEHIALVGHSGAGKSTVAMLLNRFYDVTKGRITVDGIDMRDLDVSWWRSQIGLVLQDNLMFNDTILENIRFARPDATEEEVREAAGRAAAASFIESMPNAYRTLIGDRGIRLSGGQRQRIAIARAILKRPTIVVLDEATSALDSVTERAVQEGIHELIEGRTAVIIAHRLSTVRSVDRIAVMEEGRVTAFAPHEELLTISPVYREMVELQKEGMLAE